MAKKDRPTEEEKRKTKWLGGYRAHPPSRDEVIWAYPMPLGRWASWVLAYAGEALSEMQERVSLAVRLLPVLEKRAPEIEHGPALMADHQRLVVAGFDAMPEFREIAMDAEALLSALGQTRDEAPLPADWEPSEYRFGLERLVASGLPFDAEQVRLVDAINSRIPKALLSYKKVREICLRLDPDRLPPAWEVESTREAREKGLVGALKARRELSRTKDKDFDTRLSQHMKSGLSAGEALEKVREDLVSEELKNIQATLTQEQRKKEKKQARDRVRKRINKAKEGNPHL